MLQVTMGNVQPALSGLSEQKIGLEHAFICLSFDFKEVSFLSRRKEPGTKKHNKWQNSRGPHLKKQVACGPPFAFN
jgi:hypothetical protein